MKIFLSPRLQSFILFAAGALFGIFLISQCAFKGDKKIERADMPAPKLYLPQVPATIEFAGEKVPVDRWDVYEAFDRELIYNYNSPGHISYLLKLSKRYFPLIEERLKANGLPDDFKYLCVAESNLQHLVSRVGATGFWQFMKTTAPGFNLEINNDVDDRYNVIKSTDAACKYLKTAYDKFGTWTAAAASYNCGMGGYNAHATNQKTKYYYDLLLPDETNKYIFRILSFKHLMSNAEELGFMVTEQNRYLPVNTRSVTVSNSIPDLAAWAISNGTNYKMLKLLNPWLRSRALAVKAGNSYEIKIP